MTKKEIEWKIKKVVTDVISHWCSELSALLPFKVRLKNKSDDSLKKIKAWVLFYFTKTLGGGPSFED